MCVNGGMFQFSSVLVGLGLPTLLSNLWCLGMKGCTLPILSFVFKDCGLCTFKCAPHPVRFSEVQVIKVNLQGTAEGRVKRAGIQMVRLVRPTQTLRDSIVSRWHNSSGLFPFSLLSCKFFGDVCFVQFYCMFGCPWSKALRLKVSLAQVGMGIKR